MQDDNFSDDDIRRMQEELLQSDQRLKEVGGPSNLQADQIMQQVNDRAAGKHVFTKTTDDRSIFVTNLPKGENGGYNTTHDDLFNFFSDCGQILTLTILTDRKTNQPKGSAYIEFATFEGLGRALDTKQNAMFNGHPLKVEKKRSLYRPPAPGGVRGRGGAPMMGGMGMGMGANGADPMTAMLSMMIAAAGKAMQQGGMGMGGMGGRGARGGGMGRGRGGGRGAGGAGGGFNNANAFGNNSSAANAGGNTGGFGGSGGVFGSSNNQGPFGGPASGGSGFGDGQPFA